MGKIRIPILRMKTYFNNSIKKKKGLKLLIWFLFFFFQIPKEGPNSFFRIQQTNSSVQNINEWKSLLPFFISIFLFQNIYSKVESKLETKLTHFLNQTDSDYSDVLLVICRRKKLFEFPVERDFANEKVLNAAQYPPVFHLFL